MPLFVIERCIEEAVANIANYVDLQSWTLIICTFTISTGFRTTSEVGGSFYIYKS